jgi:predicted Zn-dependent peptidase
MSIRLTTLDNGLRIVTDTMSAVETVSVGAWVNAGARHEHPSINGISHMLEHMAFKGTRRRSARDIATEIEAVGGHVNAYTSREHTAYYAKMLKEDTPLALDIIADILQHSVMDTDELDRERTVILQEIHQSHDTPDDIVFDLFQETAFPDQAIGRPVLGTIDLVSGFTRQTLIDYMSAQYAPSTIVVAAAGNVEHDSFVELTSKAFGDLPSPTPRKIEPTVYSGGDLREHRDLEQVHYLMGFNALAYEDPEYHAASVYTTLLGGGMSSRLFQEIREAKGLVYAIYSFMSSFQDGGIFGVYAGTGQQEVSEVVSLVCHELMRSTHDITEEETARARAQLKASILMSLESTSSRCEQAARQLLIFDRIVPLEETIAKIEAVDASAVENVAKRILSSPLTVTALGPINELETYDSISKRLI